MTATIKAVIVIGGPSRGTRFRPLSFKTPKPLFPIAGKPLLYHHVKACAEVNGLTEVLLIGFYETSLFASFIETTSAELGIRITYLRERTSMGTGGGVYHFREQILMGSPEFFFVLHSDVYGSFHLGDMLEAHLKRKESLGAKAKCTILGKKMPVDVVKNFGVVVADEQGVMLHYAEKPSTFVSDIINCGVYLMDASIFETLEKVYEKNKTSRNIFDRDPEAISLEQDVFLPLRDSGSLFVYVTRSQWGQIKSAGSALPANTMYLEIFRAENPNLLTPTSSTGPTIIGPTIIHPNARLSATCKIGPNVTIGSDVTIGEGVRVSNAIILARTRIADHACITNAIIDYDCFVGQWSRVEGVSATPTEQLRLQVPQLAILGEHVFVKDELIIRNCIVMPDKELKSSHFDHIIM